MLMGLGLRNVHLETQPSDHLMGTCSPYNLEQFKQARSKFPEAHLMAGNTEVGGACLTCLSIEHLHDWL
jgi:hypothetical protein